jgi:hypothetical protein
MTCLLSKTGPSVQHSRYRQPSGSFGSRVGTTHDWQVPMPHAIMRSMHTWQVSSYFSQIPAIARIMTSGPQV